MGFNDVKVFLGLVFYVLKHEQMLLFDMLYIDTIFFKSKTLWLKRCSELIFYA